MELFVDVFLLLAPESAAVKGCKIPVTVRCREVDFLNAQSNRDGYLVEAVLVADVDVLDIYFNSFNKTEYSIQPKRGFELFGFLLTLFT